MDQQKLRRVSRYVDIQTDDNIVPSDDGRICVQEKRPFE